ncbi:sigma-70 family RNA polymerase sigma factor [Escherichia marmotae]|uniref:sigma-70 family RNA polymerase sigma factor n=1 Tax=Escherichia marmotae TaxID=1499973 RepID=UPI002433C93D|nr:sigma-70 family RNA polymerase sigma factor [Escherichia marmotae]WFZ13250.1 sigma-70 family RNA polymerase sigma factor [Escherichia marmotae]
MGLVFILASDNNFFNYGMELISNTNKKIKCVEFNGIDTLTHKDIASKKYLVCDDVSYYIYSLLFAESSIKCICIKDIKLHNGTVCVYESNTSIIESINSFNNIEREIFFLYFFHQKRVKEIAKITCLSTGKIYYRFNRIKSKLGIETTRKLPASLKKFFNQRVGNQHKFVNRA